MDKLKINDGKFKGTAVKQVSDFPIPAGMSPTKLSLAGKKLVIPGLGEFG
jgi:hypothetical protein